MSRFESSLTAVQSGAATPEQREYVSRCISLTFARIEPPPTREYVSPYTVWDPFEQARQVRWNAWLGDWSAVVDLASTLLRVDPDLESAHPRRAPEWGNKSSRFAHEGWAEARARV